MYRLFRPTGTLQPVCNNVNSELFPLLRPPPHTGQRALVKLRPLRGSLTPPQFRVLARSLPVPRGRMATGGGGRSFSSSSTDRTQPTWHTHTHTVLFLQDRPQSHVLCPLLDMASNSRLTVPSPPHARILRLGTLAYNSNLHNHKQHKQS